MKPYVGITGYKTIEEVLHSAANFENAGFGNEKAYTGMLGFLVTQKNLKDHMRVGSRAPALNDLKKVMSAVPKSLFPVMHYCSFDPENIGNQAISAFKQTGVYEEDICKAVQINNEYWPEKSQIELVKDTFPDMEIILQVPTYSNETNHPHQVVDKIKEYAPFIDAVLVDPSAGAGIPFGERSLELLQVLNYGLNDVLIGIAGGLTPDGVSDKIDLIQKSTDSPFFIDIEGKVRNQDGLYLDRDKVETYISNSAKSIF